MEKKNKKHMVLHHNMFGPSCIVENGNSDDLKIFCYKKKSVCIPNCNGCPYFEHAEMGYGVCCAWEETYEAMPSDEHVVNIGSRDFEFMRVVNPDIYKGIMKAIREDDDFDICKAWYGID